MPGREIAARVEIVESVTSDFVDESARGRGIGEALTMRAVSIATELGARTVDLSSRPEREAANRLYQRLGFQLRDSRLYRFTP